MKSGIYKYTNRINDKVYIGSAVSLSKRHWEHLNYPAKSAKLLQAAFNKYGKENFDYEVLEEAPKHLLYTVEQGWINWYKCYERDKGYNLSRFAEGSREGCTKETAAKGLATKKLKGLNKSTYPQISLCKLGSKNPMYGKSGKLNTTSKTVYAYTLNKELIGIYESSNLASKALNVEASSIRRVARKQRMTTNNMIFTYEQI